MIFCVPSDRRPAVLLLRRRKRRRRNHPGGGDGLYADSADAEVPWESHRQWTSRRFWEGPSPEMETWFLKPQELLKERAVVSRGWRMGKGGVKTDARGARALKAAV